MCKITTNPLFSIPLSSVYCGSVPFYKSDYTGHIYYVMQNTAFHLMHCYLQVFTMIAIH